MNFVFRFYKPSVSVGFQTHTPAHKYCSLNDFCPRFSSTKIKLCPLLASDVEVRQEWVAPVAAVYKNWLSMPGPSLVSLLPNTCVGVTSLTNLNSQTAAVQRSAPGAAERGEAQTEKPHGLVLLTKFTLFKTEKPWVIYIVVCFEFIIWCLSKSKPDSFFGVFVLCSSGCLPGECWETGMVTSLHLHSFVPQRLL